MHQQPGDVLSRPNGERIIYQGVAPSQSLDSSENPQPVPFSGRGHKLHDDDFPGTPRRLPRTREEIMEDPAIRARLNEKAANSLDEMD